MGGCGLECTDATMRGPKWGPNTSNQNANNKTIAFLLLLVRQLLLEAMHLLLVASFYCFCYVLLFPQSFNMRRAGPTLLLRRGVGWDSYCREDGKTKIVRPSFPPHDMSIDCLHMESEEECAS